MFRRKMVGFPMPFRMGDDMFHHSRHPVDRYEMLGFVSGQRQPRLVAAYQARFICGE